MSFWRGYVVLWYIRERYRPSTSDFSSRGFCRSYLTLSSWPKDLPWDHRGDYFSGGGDGSAKAVGMPGGAAEDIPVCLDLETASVMAIEKKKKKKNGQLLYSANLSVEQKPNALVCTIHSHARTSSQTTTPALSSSSHLAGSVQPVHKLGQQLAFTEHAITTHQNTNTTNNGLSVSVILAWTRGTLVY